MNQKHIKDNGWPREEKGGWRVEAEWDLVLAAHL